MASQRFRLDIDTAAGGVPTYSSVVYAQTAGATTGFIDVYLDNADIKSMAMLEHALEVLNITIRDLYRTKVGGV